MGFNTSHGPMTWMIGGTPKGWKPPYDYGKSNALHPPLGMVDTVGAPIKIVILGRVYSIGFTTLCSLSQLNIVNAFSTTEYLGGPICAVGL